MPIFTMFRACKAPSGLGLPALVASLLALAAHPTVAQEVYPRYLHGLEIERLDAHTLRAYRGSAAGNAARRMLVVRRNADADIRRVGIGGRDDSPTATDVETLGDALAFGWDGPRATYGEYERHAGEPLRGWYTPVYVGRPGRSRAGGEPVEASLILTRHVSSMRANAPYRLALPEGYTVRRTAPIAYFYDPVTGFRPMRCYGWPLPFCVWTRGGGRVPALREGMVGTGKPVEIDAGEFVPPTGRLLRLLIVARWSEGEGDANGLATVRVLSLLRDGDGTPVVVLSNPGAAGTGTIEFPTTSARRFHIVVPRGVTVDLLPLGFSMAQPT